MKKIRVVIAEDHEIVRAGFTLLINGEADMEVVGEAGNGREALAKVRAVKPNVVLLDVSMPEVNGLQAARSIREAVQDTAIVVLTRYDDQAYVHEFLHAGVSGYVLKQSAARELLTAIRAAAHGARHLDSNLTDPVAKIDRRRDAPRLPHITDRETEVLRLMARGHSNKEISASLGVSVKTVEVHKANGMRKLGLQGRIDVVKYAVLQGWLEAPDAVAESGGGWETHKLVKLP
jgi:two-component system, NarL family, response regulator NreC